MQPPLLFCTSMFSFCRLAQVEKLLSAPADRHFDSDREIKVAAQMKRQMSRLLQTGRRMRQMVSLCRARAESPGLSSCSVISIKEKRRLFRLIGRVKAFGRGCIQWQRLALGSLGRQLYSIRTHYPPDMDILPLQGKF